MFTLSLFFLRLILFVLYFAFILIYLVLMGGNHRATDTLRVRLPDSSKHSTSTLLLPIRTAKSEETMDISSLVQGMLTVRFPFLSPLPICLNFPFLLSNTRFGY